MNNKDLFRSWSLPACNVVIVLATGKWNKVTLRIAFV